MSAAITFLAEIVNGKQETVFQSTSVAIHVDPKGSLVHVIETAKPTVPTYWTNWGGTYDNPDTTFFVLFFEVFLKRVSSIEELLLVENSMFVSGTQIYFHTPKYPWQYLQQLSTINFLSGYSTSVSDPRNQSDDTFGGVRYPTLMKIPKLGTKLSDPANGIFLQPNFSVTLINNNGEFDSELRSGVLNTPVSIYKSSSFPATIETFKKIKEGFIENSELTLENLVLTGADIYRTLDEPVCRTVSEGGFLSVESPSTLMPVAYGPQSNSKLVNISDLKYLPCDPVYLTSVSAVYNKDGASISYTLLNDGTIETSEEASLCDFVGSLENKLGQIIVNELAAKSAIPYSVGYWNIPEVDAYIATSPEVNVLRTGGKVKDIVNDCLKSDSAFLIQQNAGKLTIRTWGTSYGYFESLPWVISQKPKRTYSDPKYYYSSLIVNYGVEDGKTTETLLYSADEQRAYSTWKKIKQGVFETFLILESAAQVLAGRLSIRFSRRAEQVEVGVGVDTSEIEMLDTVRIPILINKTRLISPTQFWITMGVDPAQDKLTLEEDIKQVIGNSGLLSEPSTDTNSGLLSEPSTESNSGLLSQPFAVE